MNNAPLRRLPLLQLFALMGDQMVSGSTTAMQSMQNQAKQLWRKAHQLRANF